MLVFPEVQRRPFLLALQRTLTAAREADITAGVLLVDVANLAEINSLHSPQLGDVTLAVVNERLLSTSTEDNVVFRIGSHHFAFLLPALDNPAHIILAMNRLRAVLLDPIEAGNEQLTLEIQIGVATSHDDTADPYAMLRRAEASLRSAHEGLSFDFIDTAQDRVDRARDRLRLEQDFVQTLNGNAFELAYQPKVNLRTGEVHSCEALLRWPCAGGGYLSPAYAIEVAESLNLGYQLTKWILSEAVRQARRWNDSLAMQIAVNVEASLVDNPDLVNLVSDTLAIWGADARLITLEVTESAVISDQESGLSNLRKLTELGIGLSIDDFGTGYSSLSYFKNIPAQELKIDRSFIRTITTDRHNRSLVDIIVKIAHLFGMSVVGEGVESREDLEQLVASGSDYAQGFYFSRPLPPGQFEAWLQNWSGRDWDTAPAPG